MAGKIRPYLFMAIELAFTLLRKMIANIGISCELILI